MTYIQHYNSPLGGILLAADEIGLTGLWFEGQKYFARDLSDVRIEQEPPVLAEAKRHTGSTSIFPGTSRISRRRCTLSALRSGGLFGKSFCRFPMGKPRPTVKSPGSLPKGRALARHTLNSL